MAHIFSRQKWHQTSKMPEVSHVRLCSNLAYNCNNQTRCVLVGQMAVFCNHDNYSKLLGTFVDQSSYKPWNGLCAVI